MSIRRIRRSGVAAAIMAVALLISGCAGGAPTPDAASARLALTPSADCPSADPYEMPFTLDSPQYQSTLGDDIVICTDGRGETVVSNRSQQVWLITDPPGLDWTGLAPTSAALLFEDATRLAGTTPGLALGHGMAARIAVAPEQVRVRLDLSLLSMWQTSKFVGDAFDKKGQQAAKLLLGRGSPLRGAAASCALGAYQATRTILTTDPPGGQSYADWVPGVIGLAGDLRRPVTTCVKDWRAAEQKSRAVIPATPPVLAEDLRASSMSRTWRAVANTTYDVAKRMGPAVVRVVRH